MFAKAVEPERLARVEKFSVSTDFLVAMLRRPVRDVAVKALSILYNWREQQQIAALLEFALKNAFQFVARLRFHGYLTIRAILRAESRKQQADEMINLRDRGHGAL